MVSCRHAAVIFADIAFCLLGMLSTVLKRNNLVALDYGLPYTPADPLRKVTFLDLSFNPIKSVENIALLAPKVKRVKLGRTEMWGIGGFKGLLEVKDTLVEVCSAGPLLRSWHPTGVLLYTG